MKENNPIVDKTKIFAIRIIRMCQHIETEKKGNSLVKTGTQKRI